MYSGFLESPLERATIQIGKSCSGTFLMAGAWRPIYRASPESQCTMPQCLPGADASGKVEA